MSGKFLGIAAFCPQLILVATMGEAGRIVDPLETLLFDRRAGVELTGALAPGTGFRFFGQS
jgi:hypothetical protein